jgi:hypothetical protein
MAGKGNLKYVYLIPTTLKLDEQIAALPEATVRSHTSNASHVARRVSSHAAKGTKAMKVSEDSIISLASIATEGICAPRSNHSNPTYQNYQSRVEDWMLVTILYLIASDVSHPLHLG